MAPPKLPKKMKRSVILRIKLRPSESSLLRTIARRAGMSMAAMARQDILTALVRRA